MSAWFNRHDSIIPCRGAEVQPFPGASGPDHVQERSFEGPFRTWRQPKGRLQVLRMVGVMFALYVSGWKYIYGIFYNKTAHLIAPLYLFAQKTRVIEDKSSVIVYFPLRDHKRNGMSVPNGDWEHCASGVEEDERLDVRLK